MQKESNWIAEIAKHLVTAKHDVAQTFVKKRALEEELQTKAQPELQDATEQLPRLQRELTQAEEELMIAEQEVPKTPMLYAYAGAAIFFLMMTVVPFFIILAGVVYWWFSKKHKEELEVITQNVAAKRTTFDTAQTNKNDGETRKENAEIWVATLENDIVKNTPKDKNFTIGKVYYPMKVTNFGDYQIVLDYAGGIEEESFKAPDISGNVDALEDIYDNISDLQRPSIMIEPQNTDGNEVDSLLGNEAKLKQVVDDFQTIVKSIPLTEKKIPLLDRKNAKHHNILSILEKQPATNGQLQGALFAVNKQTVQKCETSVSEFSQMIASQAQDDKDIGQQLDASFHTINDTISLYGQLRTSALNVQQDGVTFIQYRSNWLNHNFYCPKCNQSEEWVFKNAKIRPTDAVNMTVEDIIVHLKQYDMSAEMLKNPDHKDRIVYLSQVIARKQDVSAKLKVGQYQSDEKDNYESQIKACDQFIEATVRFFLFGTDSKIREVNPKTRLRYVPIEDSTPDYQGDWECGVCDSTWAEGAIDDSQDTKEYLADAANITESKLAAIPQWKESLLIPMWNHLWHEQSQFRKQAQMDIEQELRENNREEGQEIQGYADSFQRETSPLITRITDLGADADSKSKQLFMTLEKLRDLDILTQSDVQTYKSMLSAGVNLAETKQKIANAKKMLENRVSIQQNLRPKQFDPITALVEASSLFVSSKEVMHHVLTEPVPMDGIRNDNRKTLQKSMPISVPSDNSRILPEVKTMNIPEQSENIANDNKEKVKISIIKNN